MPENINPSQQNISPENIAETVGKIVKEEIKKNIKKRKKLNPLSRDNPFHIPYNLPTTSPEKSRRLNEILKRERTQQKFLKDFVDNLVENDVLGYAASLGTKRKNVKALDYLLSNEELEDEIIKAMQKGIKDLPPVGEARKFLENISNITEKYPWLAALDDATWGKLKKLDKNTEEGVLKYLQRKLSGITGKEMELKSLGEAESILPKIKEQLGGTLGTLNKILEQEKTIKNEGLWSALKNLWHSLPRSGKLGAGLGMAGTLGVPFLASYLAAKSNQPTLPSPLEKESSLIKQAVRLEALLSPRSASKLKTFLAEFPELFLKSKFVEKLKAKGTPYEELAPKIKNIFRSRGGLKELLAERLKNEVPELKYALEDAQNYFTPEELSEEISAVWDDYIKMLKDRATALQGKANRWEKDIIFKDVIKNFVLDTPKKELSKKLKKMLKMSPEEVEKYLLGEPPQQIAEIKKALQDVATLHKELRGGLKDFGVNTKSSLEDVSSLLSSKFEKNKMFLKDPQLRLRAAWKKLPMWQQLAIPSALIGGPTALGYTLGSLGGGSAPENIIPQEPPQQNLLNKIMSLF